VRSPASILVEQADLLARQTNGILVGELTSHDSEGEKGDETGLALDIVVPALDGFRQRILVAKHAVGMPYPVRVDADVFRVRLPPPPLRPLREALEAKPPNRADSDTEFIEVVGKVLRSPHVTSVAQSLLALANERFALEQHESQGT
jgi:hypothetical protein